MGIITTDLKPKLSMSEAKIGSSNIKVYGIAKGSGMIYPNMATTLGFIFTDANLSSSILKDILKKILKQHLMQFLVTEIQVQMIWYQYFQLIKQTILKLKNK